jgi:outer membrane protein OmpA-like peptidoglycan-associated protein
MSKVPSSAGFTKKVQWLVFASWVFVPLCAGAGEVNRNGSWYNRPERIKGTAFSESASWEAPRIQATQLHQLQQPLRPIVEPVAVATPRPAVRPEPIAEEVVTFENIYFDYDKSDLRSASKVSLDKWAKYLSANTQKVASISGHCDSVASNQYNDKLSLDRASAAKVYLQQKGIANSRIQIVGRGEEDPAATNETAEGRQLNRRCQFKIAI